MITRLVRLIGMTALLVSLLALPAHADDELGLSRDGVNWSQSITNPIFDESMRWVPGDLGTATFYIRNQGGTTGDLTIDLLGSRVGNLIDSGDLHVTATGGNGSWTTVSEAGTHRLLTTPNIPDGKAVPINVTVAFDFSSPNATQNRTLDVNFRVTLSESTALAPSDGSVSEGDVDNGSGLPGTGAPAIGWFVAIGAMLVGVGLALVRRRRDQAQEVSNA